MQSRLTDYTRVIIDAPKDIERPNRQMYNGQHGTAFRAAENDWYAVLLDSDQIIRFHISELLEEKE